METAGCTPVICVAGMSMATAKLKAAPRIRLFEEAKTLSPENSKNWFLMEDFLLTGSGKIQKFVLRQQWADGRFTKMS